MIQPFYPRHIRESRYSGTYSDGYWILAAGVYHPEDTDAFGGDIPCMTFWRDRRDDPVAIVDGRGVERRAYFAAGNDIESLLEDFDDFVYAHVEFEVSCSVCDYEDVIDDPVMFCPECDDVYGDEISSTRPTALVDGEPVIVDGPSIE